MSSWTGSIPSLNRKGAIYFNTSRQIYSLVRGHSNNIYNSWHNGFQILLWLDFQIWHTTLYHRRSNIICYKAWQKSSSSIVKVRHHTRCRRWLKAQNTGLRYYPLFSSSFADPTKKTSKPVLLNTVTVFSYLVNFFFPSPKSFWSISPRSNKPTHQVFYFYAQ